VSAAKKLKYAFCPEIIKLTMGVYRVTDITRIEIISA
jgi:hypothetical protein